MGIMSIRKVAQKILAPVIIVLVVALTVGMFYIGLPAFSKDATSYRGKAVKLDGKVIKDSEFQGFLERAYSQASQYQQYGLTFTDAQIRDNALKMAVNDLAFQNEMEKVKDKIKATDKEAEAMIKKYLPTEEELKNFLNQQGFDSKKDLIKAVKEDIRRQKFIQLKGRELKIEVSKNEVLEQIEQVTVSHILIGLNDSEDKLLRTEAEALARANEVYTKATSGSDFAELAKQYTDDTGSKESGGSLGTMSISQFKGTMVQEFANGALALKEGEISKPVKSSYGYHIIKLDKREMPTGDDYKTKYKEAEDALLLSKTQQSSEFEKWITKVYENAESKMEILDPAMRAYQLTSKEKWTEAASAYEKAFKLKYYKKNWPLYIEASKVYLKLNKSEEALAVLKKVSAEAQDNIEYQIALATVYKESSKPKKAEEILTAFSAKNPDDKYIHQQLKEQFTTWKMTKAAEKEAEIVANLEKKEQAEMEAYQNQLNSNNNSQTESK